MLRQLTAKMPTICVAATIVGCSAVNSQGVMPMHASGQSEPVRLDRGQSWMLPEATNEDLLYVSTSYLFDTYVGYRVAVLAYPSGKHVGWLQGFSGAGGECVDKQGDVFVMDWGKGGASIAEFAHGGSTPIATLKDPPRHVNCAVDLVTGDLAVANGSSNVAIFHHARGKPTFYRDPSFKDYKFCTYDDKGNLFIDGLGKSHSSAAFAELPRGAHSFTDITLDHAIGRLRQLRAAQGEIAIAGTSGTSIYRFKISGHTGSLAGTTHLGQPPGEEIRSFWIQNGDVTVAYCCEGSGPGVRLFAYPSGGRRKRTFDSGGIPTGTAVSLAASSEAKVRSQDGMAFSLLP